MSAHPYNDHPQFWLGRFAYSSAMTLKWIKKHPKAAEETLRELLSEYMRSPIPGPDECAKLRAEMRKKT